MRFLVSMDIFDLFFTISFYFSKKLIKIPITSYFPYAALNLPEKEVVLTSISFFMLLNGNNLNVLNVTDQFLYTMIAFLGKENAFLDTHVGSVLANFVQSTFTSHESLDFASKLSGRLNIFSSPHIDVAIGILQNILFIFHIYLIFVPIGKFNFENLYIALLDQFQGVSYGDRTFSRLVIAPLAQKHNIKWRQMIWSEHIHVLRFVTCSNEEVNL